MQSAAELNCLDGRVGGKVNPPLRYYRRQVQRLPRRSWVRYGLAAALVVLAVLGGDAGSLTPCRAKCAQDRKLLPEPAPTSPAAVRITPPPGAHGVDPVAPVSVVADAGTLTDVRMVNNNGTQIAGVITPDDTYWKPVVPPGYGRTYTIAVVSRGPSGIPANQVSTFSTLTPPNQTKVLFTTTSEAAVQNGGTFGVGTVIVAHFDEEIADRPPPNATCR